MEYITPSMMEKIFHDTIGQVYRKIRLLSSLRADPSGSPPDAEDVKNVLIINACSRSGSSLLFYLLANHPQIASLNGEEVPFYKLSGIGAIRGERDSDYLPPGSHPDPERLQTLRREILADLGTPASRAKDGNLPDLDLIAYDSAKRILLQWVDEDFDPEELYSAAAGILRKRADHRSGFGIEDYWCEFLSELMRQGRRVNPYYYDLPERFIRNRFPRLNVPEGPPCTEIMIEEPPFVLPRPRLPVDAGALKEKTLLMKSSLNTYRIPLLLRLFPKARYRFIHLVRNPLASINGLMDGWLHRGFFSHNLSPFARLRIKGYSERMEGGERWWKFHLPPSWTDHVEDTLDGVCAFQWESANRTMLADIQSGVIRDFHTIKYEDLTGYPDSRRALMAMLDFAGLDPEPLRSCFESPPVVMAVSPPMRGKWKARGEILRKRVSGCPVREVSEALGYRVSGMEDWP